MEDIPLELVLNWDQMGIKIVSSSAWTMEQGAKHVEIIGVSDKRQITAVFCGSATGDFLPIQVIYKGKTNRCHPRYKFPTHWHITHSPKHWSNEKTMIAYITDIIVPYVERHRQALEDDVPALVIMDNFKGNIHVCLLPPNTTDLLQPMDIAVNKPAKDFLKRNFEEWYSEKIANQLEGNDIDSIELQPISLGLPHLKELGAKWLVEMAYFISEKPHFIVNGFRRAGILQAIDGLDAGEEVYSEDDTDSEEYDSDESDNETDSDS